MAVIDDASSHLKKIPLHQGMVVDHVIGDGEFSSIASLYATGSMITGTTILPQIAENTLIGGNGNLILNSLGNNWPIEPTNHNNNFPVPNLISNMFDGNKATAFRSLGPSGGKTSFLIFDFGREVLPGKIVITFPHLNNNPNFAAGGDMQVAFHDDLSGKNFSLFEDVIFPLNSFTDSNIIQTTAPAGVYKARVYEGTGTSNPDPDKATSIIGDDEGFIINEFVINNPTNTGDTEGNGVVMTRGRRYMTLAFTNTTFSGNFGISNIEFFEKVSGLDYLKQYDVEFDDALLDLQGWKNPRYYGSKLTGRAINKYKGGDITYGRNPVVENKTTALYIVDTVIGGTEDPQFSQIKAHSYLGIKQILIIDEQNRSVDVIDRNSEDFESFHRYITTDFPTGGKFRTRIVDKSIQNNLKKEYFVKFNKGYLLRAFNYKQTKTKPDGSNNILGNNNPNFAIFNSIFLYGDNINRDDFMDIQIQGSTYGFEGVIGTYNFNLFNEQGILPSDQHRSGSLFFNFANSYGVFPGDIDSKMNPRFESSSIFENKFTKQYYSSSLGFIKDKPRLGSGHADTKFLNSAFYKASKFIMLDTLNFLKENETTTELYLTLLQGSKDLAPGFNDERSIGLFEVSAETEITTFDNGMEFLPRRNELKLRGKKDDGRFYPTTNGHTDNIRISYLEEGGVLTSSDNENGVPFDTHTPKSDFVTAEGSMFLQGGLLGSRPRFRPELNGNPGIETSNIPDWTKENDYSGSYYDGDDFFNVQRLDSDDNFFDDSITGSNNSNYDSYQITSNGLYGVPQFDYDLSFLDKDHTLIVDIDKETELFDGIGNGGLVLIPEQISPDIKRNIDYYLKQAGITEKKVKRIPRRPERGR